MTGNDVIEEVVREMLAGTREEMNKLAVNVGNGDEPFTFTYPLGSIREGAQVTIDMELARVWSVDEASKTAIVERGLLGSYADNHLAGQLVYVNPRFPRYAVFKALNDEIRALSAHGLYRIETTEFEADGLTGDYPLPADVIDVYDVYVEDLGPTDEWPRLPYWDWNPHADETVFPNGKSIHVPMANSSRMVRVVYKTDFTTLADPSNDLLSVAGIPLSAQDILHWGVMLRLGPNREIKRNFTENQRGDGSRREEVQAGAVVNSFSWINKIYERRLTEERKRLARENSPRKPA